MNFKGLKHRVERTEALLDGRVVQTTDRYRALRVSWREAWTPSRIMITGLLAGFLTGSMEPQRALSRLGKLGKVSKVVGPKSLQLITAVSGLVTSLQATIAAATAEKAADTADDAAQTADVAATAAADASAGAADTRAPGAAARTRAASQTASAQRPSTPAGAGARDAGSAHPHPDRGRPDPVLSEQPRPAEASTELSESGR